MATFESKLGKKKFSRLDREMKRVIDQTLKREGRIFERKFIRERLSGPTAPNSLSRRSGALARTVSQEVETTDTFSRLSARVGSASVPYARIHEEGGVITPKQARALAIPTRRALTGAGVARFGPRDVPDLFVVSKFGKAFLVQRQKGKGKKSKRLNVMFTLVPRVIIPARLGFRKSFVRTANEIRDSLKAALQFFQSSPI